MLRQIVIGRPNGIRRTIVKKTWEFVRTYLDDGSSTVTTETTESESKEESQETKIHEPPKEVTPPKDFEVVLHKDALEVDNVTQVIIAGTAIALARNTDGFFAVENTCTHVEGVSPDCPMSDGWVDKHKISCPYHGWEFDLRNGSCSTNPHASLKTYEVRVLENAVCVKL